MPPTKAERKSRTYDLERQEIISEVPTKSYEIVRLRRLKYSDNDYSFIDVRVYRRGYDEEGNEAYFPTQRGVQLREDLYLQLIGRGPLLQRWESSELQ